MLLQIQLYLVLTPRLTVLLCLCSLVPADISLIVPSNSYVTTSGSTFKLTTGIREVLVPSCKQASARAVSESCHACSSYLTHPFAIISICLPYL